MLLWPFALYCCAVAGVVAFMLGLSWFLGERHQEHATGDPYESGIRPVQSAQVRYGASFYLVAMFFVIFDLEAVFLFSWALVAREAGWPGYVEILIFNFVLMSALVYLWRTGGLDWGTTARLKHKDPGGRS